MFAVGQTCQTRHRDLRQQLRFTVANNGDDVAATVGGDSVKAGVIATLNTLCLLPTHTHHTPRRHQPHRLKFNEAKPTGFSQIPVITYVTEQISANFNLCQSETYRTLDALNINFMV